MVWQNLLAWKLKSWDVCFRHSWIQGQEMDGVLFSPFLLYWFYTQAGALHVVVLAAPSRIPPSLHPTIHPEVRSLLFQTLPT